MNRRHRPRDGNQEVNEPSAMATAFGGPVQDPRLMPRESALTDLSQRAIAFLGLAGCGAVLWVAPSLLPAVLAGQIAAALWTIHVVGPLIAVLAGMFGAIHTARYARARVVPSETPVRADGGHATATETRPAPDPDQPSMQIRRLSASLGAVGVAVLATWLLIVLPFPTTRWMVSLFAVVRPVLTLVVVACILFVLTLIEAGARERRETTTTTTAPDTDAGRPREQKQEGS